MSKRYDIILKKLIKGVPYKFLELITGKKFSSIKFLEVKLHFLRPTGKHLLH